MGKGRHLGEFEEIVLLSLARLERRATGRRIYEELVSVTGREVSVATVHITLNRLEEKGHVRSSRVKEHGGGRALKCFDLEPSGARALEESRDELARLWAGAHLHPELGGE